MLLIVPGGIIALMIPFYLRTALRSSQHVRSGRLLWAKLGVGLILAVIQSSCLAVWHNASLFGSYYSLAASACSLLASVGILVILYICHTYPFQPSSFLSVLLSLTIVFDINTARSLYRRNGLENIYALQSCVIMLKFAMVILEEVPKRTLLRVERSHISVSPEDIAGFWNRATFTWLIPLLKIGFVKELSLRDLPEIGKQLDCVRYLDDFFLRWENSSLALARVLVQTLFGQLAKVIVPRLAFVLLRSSQPFLLLLIVQGVKAGGVNRDISWALILCTACVFAGITVQTPVSRALQAHYHFRVVTIVRGILITAIYEKMQKLDHEDLSNAAAVTLMTTDTTGVENVISLTYQVWSFPLQVGLGIWSLHTFVGPASFLMLLPGCCNYPREYLTRISIIY
ncbi:ABC bile acid transporter [Cordyceps javanica]|uniref:ABC bile acid transporter n=1 Tax=Cordyceps javanica TaxID=43265 RepID=A0A545V911_9HYPO|nr:ABC bile acid transporter [Cordyceps javanica]